MYHAKRRIFLLCAFSWFVMSYAYFQLQDSRRVMTGVFSFGRVVSVSGVGVVVANRTGWSVWRMMPNASAVVIVSNVTRECVFSVLGGHFVESPC